MADFNPLQATGEAELVRRLLGEDLVLGAVSPEVTWAFVSQVDRPEWHYLRRDTRYTSQPQVTATPGAGLFSAVELLNPLGSLRIVVMEKVILAAAGGAGGAWRLVSQPSALGGGVGNGTPLDFREPLTRTSASQFRISATLGAALGGLELERAHTGGGTGTEENIEFLSAPGIVVPPGARLSVGALTAAVLTEVTFIFREKVARPEELAG